MNIIALDTSTSIGFDEAKPILLKKVNEILNGAQGIVIFLNTNVDGSVRTSCLKDNDFDMRGSSSIWDSLFHIIDDHRHLSRVNFFVITDGKDTSSFRKTCSDIEHELWYLQLVNRWNVTWVDWRPLKRTCLLFL
jgi:hypothetical protein